MCLSVPFSLKKNGIEHTTILIELREDELKYRNLVVEL